MPPLYRTRSTAKAESARMEESSHTTILDLPTELLYLIFEQLRVDDLYALAILCRRRVALSIYLSRHNISTPIRRLWFTNVLGTTTYAALPGIRLSVSARDCFDLDHSFTRSVSEIQAIRHLVFKKPMIPFVTLRFKYHRILPGFEVALGGLLDSLCENSCTFLAITGEAYVGFTGIIKYLRPLTSLSVFIIWSSVPFSYFFLDWAIQSMNGSPLQTLELRSNDDFTTILPHLTLASLKQLHIFCPDLHFNDLLAFLSRHPTIKTFTLARISDTSTNISRIPYHVLPNLTLLTAKTEYISHLFSSARPLQSLTTITILGPTSFWPALLPVTDFSSLHRILLCISHRKNIRRILLTLGSDEETQRWLNIRTQPKLAAKRPERLLFQVTSLHVTYVGHYIIPLIPGWLSIFPALSSVEIVTGVSGDTFDDRDAVTFVRSIADECPRMGSVGIDGRIKSVAQWLAD